MEQNDNEIKYSNRNKLYDQVERYSIPYSSAVGALISNRKHCETKAIITLTTHWTLSVHWSTYVIIEIRNIAGELDIVIFYYV